MSQNGCINIRWSLQRVACWWFVWGPNYHSPLLLNLLGSTASPACILSPHLPPRRTIYPNILPDLSCAFCQTDPGASGWRRLKLSSPVQHLCIRTYLSWPQHHTRSYLDFPQSCPSHDKLMDSCLIRSKKEQPCWSSKTRVNSCPQNLSR